MSRIGRHPIAIPAGVTVTVSDDNHVVVKGPKGQLEQTVNKNITRLNLHGIGMRTQSGVAARYLQVFADNDIQVMMVTTSEICISCIVRNEDAKKAATAIQAAFQLQ